MKSRIESEIIEKRGQLRRQKSVKSPFKVHLNKTLPMIENLSQYWVNADGVTKRKILGCILKKNTKILISRVATIYSLLR